MPEEFAAAYRAAYEQALAAQSVPLSQGEHADRERRPPRRWTRHRDTVAPKLATNDDVPPEEDDHVPAGDAGTTTRAIDRDEEWSDLPERTRAIAVGTHRTEEYDERTSAFERVRDSRWFVPLLLALLVLLLVLGAYAVGRVFSGRVEKGSVAKEEPRILMEEKGSPDKKQPVSQQKAGKDAWTGVISALDPVSAKAGCTSPPAVDASGAQVSYAASHLIDGAADTTWRCDGKAIGKKLTFDLGRRVAVGEVGLIPGYAKTDPVDGTDRYAENNRVTRVRWTVGSLVVEQKISGGAKDRSLRQLRIPRTTTDTVTLEILGIAQGPRDATAISEVQLGRAG